jgi:hypothetical protein
MAYIRIEKLDLNGGDSLHEFVNDYWGAIERGKQLISGNPLKAVTISKDDQNGWNVFYKDLANTKPQNNDKGTSILYGSTV